MLARRMLKWSSQQGFFCPVGAEGYNSNGTLIFPQASSGWVLGPAGMVVFKTDEDYGDVACYPGEYEILNIGGGGAGQGSGSSNQGYPGGGAGGLIYGNYLASYSVPILVGVRGERSTGSTGHTSGGNSVLGNLTAYGGGAGSGVSGGSGAGGSGKSAGGETGGTAQNNNVPTGMGFGNNGGNGYNGGWDNRSGGGGGGSGSQGTNGSSGNGGNGGNGRSYFGFTYAGGGGGGYTHAGSGGSGGSGGGGAGGAAVSGSPANGSDATGFGSGGGGAAGRHDQAERRGGHGTQGIILVRWGIFNYHYNPTDSSITSCNGTSNGLCCERFIA